MSRAATNPWKRHPAASLSSGWKPLLPLLATILLGTGAATAAPALEVAPQSISATGPVVSPNPAAVGQRIKATLLDVKATLPAAVGSGILVGWAEGPEFAFDWGTFSESKGASANGSFPTPGTHTITVRATARGTATYVYDDGTGNPREETRPIVGRRTFEANVLVLEPDTLAVLVSVPKRVSVNQKRIPVTATVVRGGERVPRMAVRFSSDALRFSPHAIETGDDGVAILSADAGPTPSPFRDGSFVQATVEDRARGKVSGLARLTVVRIEDPTPAHPKILDGAYGLNQLYSVVLTYTVSPPIQGVPVAFAFAPGQGKGVNYPAALEEASETTDAAGQASVRVRSSDLRESPTVLCRFGESVGSTDVTFEGITSVEMIEVK